MALNDRITQLERELSDARAAAQAEAREAYGRRVARIERKLESGGEGRREEVEVELGMARRAYRGRLAELRGERDRLAAESSANATEITELEDRDARAAELLGEAPAPVEPAPAAVAEPVEPPAAEPEPPQEPALAEPAATATEPVSVDASSWEPAAEPAGDSRDTSATSGASSWEPAEPVDAAPAEPASDSSWDPDVSTPADPPVTPAAEPAPVSSWEPSEAVVEPEPEPVVEAEPVAEPEPLATPETEPIPVAEPEPEPASEATPAAEPEMHYPPETSGGSRLRLPKLGLGRKKDGPEEKRGTACAVCGKEAGGDTSGWVIHDDHALCDTCQADGWEYPPDAVTPSRRLTS